MRKKKDDERDATRARPSVSSPRRRAMSRSTAGRKPRSSPPPTTSGTAAPSSARSKRRRRARAPLLRGLRLEAVRAHRDGAGGCARSLASQRERLATAIKWRLEMLEPVIESWPAALAAQAARGERRRDGSGPKRVALLADELVGVMGAQGVRAEPRDDGRDGVTRSPGTPSRRRRRQTDKPATTTQTRRRRRGETAEADEQKKTPTPRERDPKKKRGGTVSTVSPSKKPFATAFASAGWYADRAAVAALYGACELFMVGDTSPGFEDTRAFVRPRARVVRLSSPPPPRNGVRRRRVAIGRARTRDPGCAVRAPRRHQAARGRRLRQGAGDGDARGGRNGEA